jgi:hypothetical protein
MSVANMQLLRRAVERESPAIVTAGDRPARRQVMIQFESSSHNNPAGMWAHYHEQDAGLLQRLIDAGEPVGVWFQSEALMLQFSSLLLKKKHGLAHKQLLIDWPACITVVEERHQPRWMIPASFQISGRVQVLAPDRAVELETNAQVWDIGMEGASLICPTDKKLIQMAKDAWLKVRLKIRGKEHDYAALYRHMSPASDHTLRLGVQFIPSGDPAAASAQEALSKLVEELSQLCGASGQSKPATHAA